MTVFIDVGRTEATVAFDYTAEAVAIIKTIAGRRWHAGDRHWTIAADQAELAARRFRSAGFDVVVDGKEAPAKPANTADPFVAMFAAVPQTLHRNVYRALAGALHPDRGGDTALMQQLNHAYKEGTDG